MTEIEKKVDESWKEQVERERDVSRHSAAAAADAPPEGATAAPPSGATAGAPPPGGGVPPQSPPDAVPDMPEAAPGEEEPSADSPLFEGLLQSLAVQATMFLGMQPDPRTGLVSEDLGQAKQIVDMLGELELKTRGNLTQREAQMMGMLLQDLRMAFVQRMQGQTAPPPGAPGAGGPPGAPPF